MPEASPGSKGSSRCCTAADRHTAARGRHSSAVGRTGQPATARPVSRPRAAPFPLSTAQAPPSRPQRRALQRPLGGVAHGWRQRALLPLGRGQRPGPAAICSGTGQCPRPGSSPSCVFVWKSLVAAGSKPNKVKP